MDDVKEQLRLLAIFHYVVAGIMALASLFPIIHLAVGIGIIAAANGAAEGDANAPPMWFGVIFVVMASLFIVSGLALASVVAMAGRMLTQHRRHTFCLVIAGIACMFFPFGTVLGVFTLIVLCKPEAKALFNGQP